MEQELKPPLDKAETADEAARAAEIARDLPESLNSVARLVRKFTILVLGFSVVMVGIIMIVTPGPAILVIPAGLAILATEFLWARRILDKLKAQIPQWNDKSAQE